MNNEIFKVGNKKNKVKLIVIIPNLTVAHFTLKLAVRLNWFKSHVPQNVLNITCSGVGACLNSLGIFVPYGSLSTEANSLKNLNRHLLLRVGLLFQPNDFLQ